MVSFLIFLKLNYMFFGISSFLFYFRMLQYKEFIIFGILSEEFIFREFRENHFVIFFLQFELNKLFIKNYWFHIRINITMLIKDYQESIVYKHLKITIKYKTYITKMYLTKTIRKCLSSQKYKFLEQLGLQSQNHGAYYNGKWQGNGQIFKSINPANQELIAQTKCASIHDYQNAISAMEQAKKQWAAVPMPVRGEIVRQIGDAFRAKKEPLGQLISLEMGKILSEGKGEVQQVIDICDMACGLSRTIGGSVFNSERPQHFMMEVWNPLGIVGVITAFNFPCAVFGWNAAIALICGDILTWKGAPTTSLVTIATSKIISQILQKNKLNPNILTVVQGGADIGKKMCEDKRIPLLSFTGSTKIGKLVKHSVDGRFGRSLLQLGGNNATIIMNDANLELAFKACTFAAVGTCGQRCTTLRRLLIHQDVFEKFVSKLVKAYATVKIGDPLSSDTLCGPLHSSQSLQLYNSTIKKIKSTPSAKILIGGNRLNRPGFYVEPTIVQIDSNSPLIKQEYFCPILFVTKFKTLEQAIKINNDVPQGLSSSVFTQDISNAFKWVGPHGSDCGIVNVNIGPSGAQIGGAFGGEKETGGGRQSGSDSWKQYMRRSTCTINYGKKVPLAQGVNFDL